MPELLTKAATSDNYTPAAQLGPSSNVKRISFAEGGQSDFFARFWKYIPNQPGKYALEVAEHYYPKSTAGAFATGVAGVQFRSATPGSPALVTADLAFINDAEIYSGAPTQVTTVVQNLSLGFQLNDVVVASQPNIDFENGGGVTWTLTNDAANNRVKVSAATATVGSSVGSTFPGSPATGQTFWLESADAQTRAFVWDGAHWRSNVYQVPINSASNPVNQTDVTSPTEIGQTSLQTNPFSTADEIAAGCEVDFKFIGQMLSAATKNGHVVPGYYTLNDNVGASGPTFPGGIASTALADGATVEFIESAWQVGPTTGKGFLPAVQLYRDGGGSGATITLYQAAMLVRFTK